MGFCCCCYCCGGHDKSISESENKQGIVEERRCRNVLSLIVFIAFWAGMFYVCYEAHNRGNIKRLVYGYDSYGFLCGVENEDLVEGEKGPDFRDHKKLYYLNPTELLSSLNINKAKKICVKSCPTTQDVCTLGEFCTNNNQFRCPYYRIAESGLYNNLTVDDKWSTAYYSNLISLSPDEDHCSLSSMNDFLTSLGIDVNCGSYYQAKSLYPGKGPCYPVYTDTIDYFNRCFPNFTEEVQDLFLSKISNNNTGLHFSAMADHFGEIGERLQRYAADITKGWMVIGVSGILAGIILSLAWLTALRYFAGVMAWILIILLNIFFWAFTLLASERSGLLDRAGEVGSMLAHKFPLGEDPAANERKLWLYVTIVSAILSLIFLLLTLVMIPRIKIAVALIKVASQAISSMPCILLFPIFSFILEVLLVAYFVFIMALLYSAGNLVPHEKTTNPTSTPTFTKDLSFAFPIDNSNLLPSQRFLQPELITREECATSENCYYSISWTNTMKYMFIYHLFGLLWTTQFIVGMGYVVVAGAIAQYYWSGGDKDCRPASPVSLSIYRAFQYHLGSVALGSFIVAIVQLLRIVLEYVNRKTKQLQEKGGEVIKYVICCLRGFLYILEKIIKFINRNAYIMVAVKGTGYCQSAGRAVSLLISNALRLAAVNVIGDVLILVGKLTVMLGCGVISFFMCNLDYYTNEIEYPEIYLSTPLLPVLLSLLVGYTVADLFFGVYEMAIDTLLLSFCEDCESHGGVPTFAPPLLMAAMGHSRKATQQNLQS